jgi:dCTP deaminase
MVLSQPDLKQLVEVGHIRFEPELQKRQWGEASIDLRLGLKFTKLMPASGVKFSVAHGLSTISKSGLWKEHELKERNVFGQKETICLEPNDFILALTHEKVYMPNDLIAIVEGRSTYARVGLTMHQTAPWIQPGWSGHITLEIRNSGPLSIELTPLVDMPCQLTFLKLTTPLTASQAYGSRPTDAYQDQTSALPGRS